MQKLELHRSHGSTMPPDQGTTATYARIDPALPPEYRLYDNYRRLRESSAVHVLEAPGGRRYCVLRYSDVAAAFKDPRFAAASLHPRILSALRQIGFGEFAAAARDGVLVSLNPPQHTRLRNVVEAFFRKRKVQSVGARVARFANELLDRRAGAKQLDLIEDFAGLLPTMVITDLMGFPITDHPRLKNWSDHLAPLIDSDLQLLALPRAGRALSEFRSYLRHVVKKRRLEPRDDVMSTLVHTEPQEEPLNDGEILGMCVFILAAGHQTTSHLIGNGMLALLHNPDQLARLRSQPELISSAIEELLRFDSPIQRTGRVLLQDVRIDETLIPAGSMVRLMIGSANRDPRRFANPDSLDILRNPNKHLAFAAGAHVCLGLHLARLEAAIAIATLIGRLRRIELVSTGLNWHAGEKLRGLKSLPLCVEIGRAA